MGDSLRASSPAQIAADPSVGMEGVGGRTVINDHAAVVEKTESCSAVLIPKNVGVRQN